MADSVVELSGTVPSVVAGRVSMAMVSGAVGELLSEPPPQAARSSPAARRATGSARRVTDRAELDLEERMPKVWQTLARQMTARRGDRYRTQALHLVESRTMRDPRYDVLFEPVVIGPKVARNRFFQVPHCNGMGHRHPTSLAAMRGAKAEGGWAVVCTEEVEIHHTTALDGAVEGRLWDDADIPAHRRIVEHIQAHGALAGIELVHSGLNANNAYPARGRPWVRRRGRSPPACRRRGGR